MGLEIVWKNTVMLNRVEARYRLEHVDAPAVLSTPAEVDGLIDSLLASGVSQNLAQLHSMQRPLLPSGYPDHELLVGADGEFRVGVLAFMDSDGNVVTLGSPEGRSEVSYSIMGHATEFPAHSEIPIDMVRRAIKEFLASGGQRPTCVQWQTPEVW